MASPYADGSSKPFNFRMTGNQRAVLARAVASKALVDADSWRHRAPTIGEFVRGAAMLVAAALVDTNVSHLAERDTSNPWREPKRLEERIAAALEGAAARKRLAEAARSATTKKPSRQTSFLEEDQEDEPEIDEDAGDFPPARTDGTSAATPLRAKDGRIRTDACATAAAAGVVRARSSKRSTAKPKRAKRPWSAKRKAAHTAKTAHKAATKKAPATKAKRTTKAKPARKATKKGGRK